MTELDNRFSTMTEVRRVLWPQYETEEFSEQMFLQGIAGTLELFHLSIVRFQSLVSEVTGHPAIDYQRIDQAGQRLPLDERILDDTDTLLVFGLDHMVTEQEAAPEEIEALQKFLTREGTCLIIGPHHDVGASGELADLQMEYAHHRDPLVPRQQRFGKYTRSLMKGLGVPVENRWGLRPAVVEGTNQIAPLNRYARSRYARMADGRANVQLPSASAPLCTDHRRHEIDSGAGEAIHRYVEASSIHRGWKSRIQLLCVDATRMEPGPATFSWLTVQSSPRCSVVTRALTVFGLTLLRVAKAAD